MTCENCGCEMETQSISCGGEPSRTYWCPNCFRMEKIGMGRWISFPGMPDKKKLS